jgi:hypothetical protein
VLEAVGIADRDRELADPQRAGRAEDDRRNCACGNAQHRDVGVRIVADQVGVARKPVGEARADPACPVHDVAIGE